MQTPSFDPDPTLNFELGETIYENKRVSEWIKFWRTLGAIILPFWPAFYVFEIYANDHVPSLDWAADAGNWARVPKQMQDGLGLDMASIRYCDDHDYMNFQYAGKRSIVRPVHTFYQVSTLAFLSLLSSDYVSKMVYNKDKDLVFVYRQDGMFKEKEYVYEVHHLEQ